MDVDAREELPFRSWLGLEKMKLKMSQLDMLGNSLHGHIVKIWVVELSYILPSQKFQLSYLLNPSGVCVNAGGGSSKLVSDSGKYTVPENVVGASNEQNYQMVYSSDCLIPSPRDLEDDISGVFFFL